MLDLTKIRIDGGTQPRTELNQEVVAEYAETYKAGETMPPVVVFYDGANYWLADGFHRFFAAKKAGLTQIYEQVETGSQRDAVLYSLSANATHGLKRSNADKRKAVMTMLQDKEWSQWSDREIARQCKVSNHLVADGRQSLTGNSPSSLVSPRKTYKKNGVTTVMNTAAIGKSKEDDYDPTQDDLAEARQTIRDLAEENERLKTTVSIETLPVEERKTTAEIIDGLQKQVTTLKAENNALKASRDKYQTESAEKQKQINYWRKRYEKAKAALGGMEV